MLVVVCELIAHVFASSENNQWQREEVRGREACRRRCMPVVEMLSKPEKVYQSACVC
jgi:hypothetical protein